MAVFIVTIALVNMVFGFALAMYLGFGPHPATLASQLNWRRRRAAPLDARAVEGTQPQAADATAQAGESTLIEESLEKLRTNLADFARALAGADTALRDPSQPKEAKQLVASLVAITQFTDEYLLRQQGVVKRLHKLAPANGDAMASLAQEFERHVNAQCQEVEKIHQQFKQLDLSLPTPAASVKVFKGIEELTDACHRLRDRLAESCVASAWQPKPRATLAAAEADDRNQSLLCEGNAPVPVAATQPDIEPRDASLV